ncbi:MAG: CoA ester lyase [Acidobacteriota bacterium]|nr:CoA ester lyase [Acidobacteriota bacterium]
MIRSLLFVPANSERFVSKAHQRGADALILDLEDSVILEQKRDARDRLQKAVPHVGQNHAKVFVRINPTTDLMSEDAEAACRAGAFGIFLPKAQSRAQVLHLANLLDHVESEMGSTRKTKIVAVVEDPNAILDARSIAKASSRVLALIAGSEDLATSMNAEPTPDFLRLPKLLVHLAAKAASVLSFGLLRTIADFNDLNAIASAVAEARTFGFDGATCVHPSVVAVLNRGFAPSDQQLEHAARLIAAFEEAKRRGEGAFMFEGKMVDKPVVERAKNLLSMGAIAKN